MKTRMRIPETEKSPFQAEYLGDGLYCQFDGYYIWLWAERGGIVHKIALEPPVFHALQKYAAGIDAIFERIGEGKETN